MALACCGVLPRWRVERPERRPAERPRLVGEVGVRKKTGCHSECGAVVALLLMVPCLYCLYRTPYAVKYLLLLSVVPLMGYHTSMLLNDHTTV